MHAEAMRFVRFARGLFVPWPTHVVEFGSRNVNGTVREVFADAFEYIGVDKAPGPGVDVVLDAAEYSQETPAGVVVCTEVLEHASNAEAICANASRVLRHGGVLILTAATDPRPPHLAVDGNMLHVGEYYRNIDPVDLRKWLAQSFGLSWVDVISTPGDIYAVAVK